MKSEIDETIVADAAALAKLELNEEEKVQAGKDMKQMLDYIDLLKELDTQGVEPLVHLFKQENVFRADMVSNGDNSEELLEMAPKAGSGQYQVPKTVE